MNCQPHVIHLLTAAHSLAEATRTRLGSLQIIKLLLVEHFSVRCRVKLSTKLKKKKVAGGLIVDSFNMLAVVMCREVFVCFRMNTTL